MAEWRNWVKHAITGCYLVKGLRWNFVLTLGLSIRSFVHNISQIWSLVHILVKRVLDQVIPDLFSEKDTGEEISGVRRNLEITTYQNVYKGSDLR